MGETCHTLVCVLHARTSTCCSVLWQMIATHSCMQSCAWHDSFMWRDSYIHVTWPTHTCDMMPDSYVWYDAFVRATERIHARIHVRDKLHSYVWHDSFTHAKLKKISLIMTDYCNTMQHTATHCNALQRTATHYIIYHDRLSSTMTDSNCHGVLQCVCCSVLQCVLKVSWQMIVSWHRYAYKYVCVAVGVLQCVPVCCASVLQCVMKVSWH